MEQIREIADLNLIAYLAIRGIKQEKSERRNRLILFLFKETSALKEIVDNYYANKAMVDPVVFGDALRRIRILVSELKRQ